MKTHELPQDVVEDLKENHSVEEIERMSPKEVFRRWLEWEGIIGFEDSILALARIVILRQMLDEAIEDAES